jgi:hypothetical protein
MSKTASSLASLPVDSDDALDPVDTEPARQRSVLGRLQVPAWLRGGSPAPTFIGVGVALVGFVLILIAWGQVAGETQVYLQMPYLVSAGLTGLALVMVGLTIVNVAAKQRDALDRDRQMDQLVSILSELKAAMTDDSTGKGRRK